MNKQEQTRKHNISSNLPRTLQKLPLRRRNAGVDLGVEEKVHPGIDPRIHFGVDFAIHFGVHGGVRNPYFFQ